MSEALNLSDFASLDPSANGLQVERRDPVLRRAAFAVDASLETFRRAVETEADLLFVHHGLLWGREARLTGDHYRRIRFLLENDLALYAVHLPLDAHPELGNNAGIARVLGLDHIEPFGEYRGLKVGLKGVLSLPESMDVLSRRVCARPLASLAFGVDEIKTVGVISGDDPRAVAQAIAEGLDLFITGDAMHEIYHQSMEAGINVLSAGHYATEIFGVRQMSEFIARETDIETVLIDVPTGL